VHRSTKWYAGFGAATLGFWLALRWPPMLRATTQVDIAVLRAMVALRQPALTSAVRPVGQLGGAWTVAALSWGTLAVLVVVRRFHHLATYLVVVLGSAVTASIVTNFERRIRPVGVSVAGHWHGYAQPSLPVVALAVALAGVTYTLAPGGRWRTRCRWAAAVTLGVVCAARLYLAVDHPSDVLAALVLGWALPVAVLRLAVPEEAFPVTYRGGGRAHLDLGGARRSAIVAALDQQLGLAVIDVDPFGWAASAGSTPIRIRVRDTTGTEVVLFAKLYALAHLRSDRWYKLARTALYGRLEDEKPFSSVRRLVEYEDHLLRLSRDAGLPVPKPYGFVEITPEREYLLVMEFFQGAREIGEAAIDDRTIDRALAIVRGLWDAGLAHRDVKPSNVLVRNQDVFLIDVAFATIRPTPWRQAVDLANMMLTLALSSTAERVYRRAQALFAPDDIAEAFAATRGVTVPSQLRARLRHHGGDLVEQFRALAPERRPVRIQVWSLRRIGLTAALAALAVSAPWALLTYGRLAGLL
jgi:tRNA A-37 threonylcarbamoyl transferase component Bud32